MSDEELKKMIVKRELSDIEIIEVLQRYISDMKGTNVIVRRPSNLHSLTLMNMMYDSACKYYYDLFKI